MKYRVVIFLYHVVPLSFLKYRGTNEGGIGMKKRVIAIIDLPGVRIRRIFSRKLALILRE